MASHYEQTGSLSTEAKTSSETSPVLTWRDPRVDDIIIVTSQLGYLPRTIIDICALGRTSISGSDQNVVPFRVNRVPARQLTPSAQPVEWTSSRFPWPFDIGLPSGTVNAATQHDSVCDGNLILEDSSWGAIWRARIGPLPTGLYQVETSVGYSPPFEVGMGIIDTLAYGYLAYLRAQRSGCEVPGVREARHLDDAIIEGTRDWIPASGGWVDAGDERKWLTTTLGHVDALVSLQDSPLRDEAEAELTWGLDFFQRMIMDDGRVWESVGAGRIPPGLEDEEWWYDNHPGTTLDGSGSAKTDNIVGTGDERTISNRYNEHVQFLFVSVLAGAAAQLDGVAAARSMGLAERAWRYGRQIGHDGRTLFVASELSAACRLHRAKSSLVTIDDVERLASTLLSRLHVGDHPFFMEANGDGFRSIAFSALPGLALLRTLQVGSISPELEADVRVALTRHIDDYLVWDAKSNPFGVAPYGTYRTSFLNSGNQDFRPIDQDYGVRTFIAMPGTQPIVHGTNSSVMQNAFLLAAAGRLLDRPEWLHLAESQIHWATGWNPVGKSLFTGIGSRSVQQFSATVRQVPFAAVAGFVGRADDTPYVETSLALEWSTQEVWGVPYYNAILASHWLTGESLLL